MLESVSAGLPLGSEGLGSEGLESAELGSELAVGVAADLWE